MPVTRSPIALCLTLAVGLLDVGTSRPQAAQQSGAADGAAAQQADTPQETPPAPEADQQPTFRADINFVRVDVIVSDDDGEPVTDLTAADFEVFEDGEPQTIEQFRLIRVDGNPPPGAPRPRQLRSRIDEEIELSRDDVRLFVFFFDDYHVRLGNSLSVREPLIRFVETQLRPNDVVGMMYPLTPVDAISFTRNHASVISAIERFEGRKFNYEPRNRAEELYSRAPSEVVERIRNEVVMGALRGLFTRLGGLREGRKAIIYVSEGLTTILPPQLRAANASLGPLANPGGRSRASGGSLREQTAAVFAQAELYSDLRQVFAAANRNNAAVYTLDPRGLAVFEFDINEAVGMRQDRRSLQMAQDMLRTLADETDGRAIIDRNDLASGLAQIVRDSSFYYLLGYNSTQAPTDGEFHSITVRLKDRRGMDVRARKGYWALTEADIVRATTVVPDTPKPILQALASIATSVQAGKYVRTWLGTARGESGKTRVTLIWEPLLPRAGARGEQPEAGRVSLIAAKMNGDLVFRGRASDVAPAAAVRAATPVVPSVAGAQRLVFEVTPGELELRMTVETASGGGLLDREIRTITVPDLTSPDAAVSTPRVYRGRTARDFRAIASDGDAAPTAAREFSRRERLLIRFDVYGNATPTAVLLSRSGEKLADLPVTAAAVGGTHQIDLGLGAIASGEYLVEITATGATSEATELVPLRVGS